MTSKRIAWKPLISLGFFSHLSLSKDEGRNKVIYPMYILNNIKTQMNHTHLLVFKQIGHQAKIQ